MGYDVQVYLKKKRISKALLAQTYAEMQKRYGVHSPEDDDYDGPDHAEYPFANFVLHLNEGEGGLYLHVDSDQIGTGQYTGEDCELCMQEWAQLLGGAISQEEWDKRIARAGEKEVLALKLPKFGAADTYLSLAFDAAGKERGRKSVANELHQVVKNQLHDPAWLCANKVTRLEVLSYGGEGTVSDHTSYDVDGKGSMRRRPDKY